MGARPLRRSIRKIIEDPLAEKVLQWGDQAHGEIIVDLDNGEIFFEMAEVSVVSP